MHRFLTTYVNVRLLYMTHYLPTIYICTDIYLRATHLEATQLREENM